MRRLTQVKTPDVASLIRVTLILVTRAGTALIPQEKLFSAVIANQRVRAKRGPLTGFAKQSIPRGKKEWIACAPGQAGLIPPVRDRSG
jgi:hypothetical protein